MHVAAGIVPVIVTVAGTALTALVAVLAAGRRAARVHPTRALQESALEPDSIGVIRLGAGVLALGGRRRAAGHLGHQRRSERRRRHRHGLRVRARPGHRAARADRRAPGGGVAARAPGRACREQGFLALANVRTSPRRFASATTPLVLCVAMSCLLLFLATTRAARDVRARRERRVTADLVVQSGGFGIPPAAVADMRAASPACRTAVGIASTTLGPTLGRPLRRSAGGDRRSATGSMTSSTSTCAAARSPTSATRASPSARPRRPRRTPRSATACP